MKVYVDLLLIINFVIDLVLLLSVSIILKRKINYYRLVLSSFIGSLSIIFLFLDISDISLFIIKLIISILMIIIAFKFKNIKFFMNNFFYLYMNSIILGGFLYFIDFNISNYYLNSYFINFIMLLILSPIIIIIYIKQVKRIKNNYNNYYDVDIYLNNHKYHYIGYFDSANTLMYKNHPVVIINSKKIKIDKYKLLPYQALNYVGLLKVCKIDKLVIDKNEYGNIFLGISDNDFKIDGVDILLNNNIGGIL